MGKRRDDRRGEGRRGRGGRSDRGKRAEPSSDLALVLVGERVCMAADIRPGPLPPKWYRIDDIQLFKPGLYLRSRGSLNLLTRALEFERAIAYVLWDDPDQEYPVSRDRRVKVGTHVGFLVPSEIPDGPPWLPIVTGLSTDAHEKRSGLLSPDIDPVGCIQFSAEIAVEDDYLVAHSRGAVAAESEDAATALIDTLRWLAANPSAESSSARAGRRLLVECGHGLQRAGIASMYESDEEKAARIESIVRPLAPLAGPILDALWRAWTQLDDRGDVAAAHLRAVARALGPAIDARPDGAYRDELGALTTWMTGLFGPRPEQEMAQPARSLFAVGRALRAVGGRTELLLHPDGPNLRFPVRSPDQRELHRELSNWPRQESYLERLVRALAIAEGGRDIRRPDLFHLRAFRIGWSPLASFPIATRTVRDRYDYVLTTWSYRGHEWTSGGRKAPDFSSHLLLDTASLATGRAFARAIASHPKKGAKLREALQSAGHEWLVGVSHIAGLDDEELAGRVERAASSDHGERDALLIAVCGLELLAARDTDQPPPPPPQRGGRTIRGRYAYWRAWCRTWPDREREARIAWAGEQLSNLQALPLEYMVEVLFLASQLVTRSSDQALDALATWSERLLAAAVGLAQSDRGRRPRATDAFRYALQALSHLDAEACASAFEAVASAKTDDLRGLDQILRAVGSSPATATIVAGSAFRGLHEPLSGAGGARAATARAAWTSITLRGARSRRAVQWLLDPGSQPHIVQSDTFRHWFATRGRRALERPADAVVELLELGLRLVDERQLDLVVRHLEATTTWPDTELLRALIEAERWLAAAEWMRSRALGDEQQIERAVDTLIERARGGHGLRHAANALAGLRDRAPEALAERRRALCRELDEYRPEPALPDGFGAAVDAWRRIRRPPHDGGGARWAKRSAEAYRRTRDERFRAYVAWAVEGILLEPIGETLAGVVAGDIDPDSLATRLETISTPDHLGFAAKLVARTKGGGPERDLREAVAQGADVPWTLQVAAERLLELDDAPSSVAERLEAVARALSPTKQPEQREPAQVEEAHSSEDPPPPRDDAQGASPTPPQEASAEAVGAAAEVGEPTSLAATDDATVAGDSAAADGDTDERNEAEASASDAEGAAPRTQATTPMGDSTQEAGAESRAGDGTAAGDPLAAAIVPRARQQLADAFKRWAALWRAEPNGTRLVLSNLVEYTPAEEPVRARVLDAARAAAVRNGVRADDPRDLTTTEYLGGETARLDLNDFSLLLDVLIGWTVGLGLKSHVALDRRAVTIRIAAAEPRKTVADDGLDTQELPLSPRATVPVPTGPSRRRNVPEDTLDLPAADETMPIGETTPARGATTIAGPLDRLRASVERLASGDAKDDHDGGDPLLAGADALRLVVERNPNLSVRWKAGSEQGVEIRFQPKGAGRR